MPVARPTWPIIPSKPRPVPRPGCRRQLPAVRAQPRQPARLRRRDAEGRPDDLPRCRSPVPPDPAHHPKVNLGLFHDPDVGGRKLDRGSACSMMPPREPSSLTMRLLRERVYERYSGFVSVSHRSGSLWRYSSQPSSSSSTEPCPSWKIGYRLRSRSPMCHIGQRLTKSPIVSLSASDIGRTES